MGKDFFDEKTTAMFEIAIQVFQFYAIYILHYASIALLEKSDLYSDSSIVI